MTKSEPTPGGDVPGLDLDHLLSAVEGSATAMMMIDRDLNVTYANPASMRLFETHAATFRAHFPGFDKDNLVGTCIDMFHKNPAHQRRLLGDPNNLPHSATISIGELEFRLNISAMLNREGHYIGSTLEWADVTELRAQEELNADYAGQIAAISKSQCIVEFDLDGTVTKVNSNFLDLLGYDEAEFVGSHHSKLLEEAERRSPDYADFWAQLKRGQFHTGVFKRIGKGNREVWIQATYNPIYDRHGELLKVVKFATDVTEARSEMANFQGQIQAIQKAQAVIEFDMDGTVLWANQNFRLLTGYSMEELQGVHHSIFVEESYRTSPEYQEFWAKLGRGEFDQGMYQRKSKHGRSIWIQASYNPILDLNGKPLKVVKFATDITERVRLQDEVNRVVSEIIRVAGALSEGDLTQEMTGAFTGRFAELQDAINTFIDGLGSTMKQTQTASAAVGDATVKLRQSSEQLAQGASQQQEALQISSEALTETSAMVQSTSENAIRANELVQQTAVTADQGRDKMNALTDAMTDISSSSGEISKIIKVIDEIAFQTNLLAVNAAVEAARAGRHGRGFAVVAQEVRSLAGRSAKAAQATAELIDQSTKTVERGVANVDATSIALEEIRESVLKVRDIVGEISAASAEQSRGVSEVRHSIDGINASAASAAQQSSELAAEANGLQAQARVLKDAVDGFTLREGSNAGPVDDEVMTRMAQLLGVEPTDLAAFADARRSTGQPHTRPDAPNAAPDSAIDLDVTDDERGYASF